MSFPTAIDFATALRIVREVGAQRRTAVAATPLREARGRPLAEALSAPIALPSFDNSAMDGYAVRVEDLRRLPARLKVAAVVHAGSVVAHEASPVAHEGSPVFHEGSPVVAEPSWVVAEPSWVVAERSWMAAGPSWVLHERSWVVAGPS